MTCTWDILTPEEQYQTLEMMSYYGGHFCQALVKTIQIADQSNTRILVEAFDHLINRYQPKNWSTQ